MKPTFKFVLLRLTEQSSWQAIGKLIVAVALLFSIRISENTTVAIGLVGCALSMVIAIFTPELGSGVNVDPDQISAAIRQALAEHMAAQSSGNTTPTTEQPK